MEIAEIKINVRKCIEGVFSIVSQCCTNSLSEDVKLISHYVVIDKMRSSTNNFNRDLGLKILKERRFISEEKLVENIFEKQEDLSWIDFVMIYSSNQETIILVEMIKSPTIDINFHCRIMTPYNFRDNSDKKFDVNWWLFDRL
ncbi:hypothetical protein [Gaoshiqia sp. Z1-71]|uniref:hypothetical protein n=1 Tax=Gaoshiqia hydrogeniformans TaxID=3290090 RepID=UPI003BF8AAB4